MEKAMKTKLVGVTHEGRQEIVKSLKPGDILKVVAEKNNPFDSNALKVFADVEMMKPVGYIKRELAKDLNEQSLHGWKYEYVVEQVTGGDKGKSRGCNITIIAKKDDGV